MQSHELCWHRFGMIIRCTLRYCRGNHVFDRISHVARKEERLRSISHESSYGGHVPDHVPQYLRYNEREACEGLSACQDHAKIAHVTAFLLSPTVAV